MSTSNSEKVPLMTLTMMVVGSMVGAGVFSLPRNFAMATGVYGALIAWTIAGLGMLMLAFVFQSLANRKPDLGDGRSRDTWPMRMARLRLQRCARPAGAQRGGQNNEEQ